VTFGKTYVPVSFVVAGASLVPLASSISVTVAPGTTPPWASFTVPVMFPVVICAEAGKTAAPNRRQTAIDFPHVVRFNFVNRTSPFANFPARPKRAGNMEMTLSGQKATTEQDGCQVNRS